MDGLALQQAVQVGLHIADGQHFQSAVVHLEGLEIHIKRRADGRKKAVEIVSLGHGYSLAL